MTGDWVMEFSKLSKEEQGSKGDDRLEWNDRFQTILHKIRGDPSSTNIDQLISLSRDFNHAASM